MDRLLPLYNSIYRIILFALNAEHIFIKTSWCCLAMCPKNLKMQRKPINNPQLFKDGFIGFFIVIKDIFSICLQHNISKRSIFCLYSACTVCLCMSCLRRSLDQMQFSKHYGPSKFNSLSTLNFPSCRFAF